MASTAGVSWLAYIRVLAVAISAAAGVSASLNAAARGLCSLGREEILPKDFGRSHSTYKTPHVALYILAPLVAIAPIGLTEPELYQLNGQPRRRQGPDHGHVGPRQSSLDRLLGLLPLAGDLATHSGRFR